MKRFYSIVVAGYSKKDRWKCGCERESWCSCCFIFCCVRCCCWWRAAGWAGCIIAGCCCKNHFLLFFLCFLSFFCSQTCYISFTQDRVHKLNISSSPFYSSRDPTIALTTTLLLTHSLPQISHYFLIMSAKILGVPIKLLHEAEGHVVTVELKNGETYRGLLDEAEDTMNVRLSEGKLLTCQKNKLLNNQHHNQQQQRYKG